MDERNMRKPRLKPVVVQHSFGELGTGGPIGALSRVLNSSLAEGYEFVQMHQDKATGGIDFGRLRQWRDLLREVEPDLVHVRGLGNEGFHGVLAAWAARCPKILVSVHGSVRDLTRARTAKERFLIDVAEPLTLKLATHVTTVCEFAARRPFIQAHRSKFVGPITNGVEVAEFDGVRRKGKREELQVSDATLMLISVGRLTWEKGHRDLAAALQLARARMRSEVVLLVVGDGPDRDAIRDVYTQTGVDVRMLGRRSDVSALLEAADLFVFPTLHENLSNALLEAMAVGLPVVATSVGGNVEVLEKGGGFLVPPSAPHEFAEAVINLERGAEARHQLGHTAREVVECNYSVETMCATIDRVYQGILEEST